MSTAVASLTTAGSAQPAVPTSLPTATLLVATDPSLTTGPTDESLLLGAPPVPSPMTAAAPVTPVASQSVSWLDDLGTYGMPLLVGGALLLALTGPSGIRHLLRRRRAS
ncbi:hypothetical protein SAMN06264364_12930 [Quadrisphaera granulorum]|uniref:Uncharacterized protein n=1 Tax=Quadrisphaera granulorum TaxID=317664 RepID=A0A315ZTL2_9ACTN|nr:hypothetical protein [Quadrisphaera granulorum]PWJ48649.1 hypothetical protein BXY45_12930 [Quadrisphaera granulorum]SZE98371.1 hypothetical protein SAMN06264364_12930 [Quadrisphaera granulorum]